MTDYMDRADKEYDGPRTFCCARKQSAQKMTGGEHTKRTLRSV